MPRAMPRTFWRKAARVSRLSVAMAHAVLVVGLHQREVLPVAEHRAAAAGGVEHVLRAEPRLDPRPHRAAAAHRAVLIPEGPAALVRQLLLVLGDEVHHRPAVAL